MIKRIVKMTFRPEETESFIELFTGRKEMIRGFEGCNFLELIRDVDNPGIFFTVSFWESDDSLQRYRKSDLFKSTWEETKSKFAAPAEAWSTNSLFILN